MLRLLPACRHERLGLFRLPMLLGRSLPRTASTPFSLNLMPMLFSALETSEQADWAVLIGAALLLRSELLVKPTFLQ